MCTPISNRSETICIGGSLWDMFRTISRITWCLLHHYFPIRSGWSSIVRNKPFHPKCLSAAHGGRNLCFSNQYDISIASDVLYITENGEGTVPGSINGWFSRNVLALVASALLWPCVILSMVLLGIHTWMALSSMTTFECVKGPELLGYLEVSVGVVARFLHLGLKYSVV